MGEQQDNRIQKPTVPFALSLLAGLWMLATAGTTYSFAWHHMARPMTGRWIWCNGMMGHFLPRFWWPWFGILSGILVLVGAGMLYAKPKQSRSCGAVIVAVSAINLLVGAGGFLASVLGIIGGGLALGWHSGILREPDRGNGPPHPRDS